MNPARSPKWLSATCVQEGGESRRGSPLPHTLQHVPDSMLTVRKPVMLVHSEPTFGVPRPAPAPSLDHRNITVENPAPDPIERAYRFRKYQAEVELLDRHLPDLDLPGKQRERFAACGSASWVMWSAAQRTYRIHTNTCKLRWCPRCRHKTAIRTHVRLTSALKARPINRWKLITLTMRSAQTHLGQQIANLKASFRRLRQRRLWREAVKGGYAVLEITFNEKTNLWHPHIHIVADSKFIEQRKLSEEWKKASKGSFIVDIRPVASQAGAIQYLTAYLAKPPSTAIIRDLNRCQEWINAMHKTRFLQAFGSVPKPSDAEEPENNPNDWQPVMRLATLLAKANSGDAYARHILTIIAGTEEDPNEPDPYESP